MKYDLIRLPDGQEEDEGACLVCIGKLPARAFMVVHCYNCHKLITHSRACYSSWYNLEWHHYCRYCEAMNVRSELRSNASELRGERLSEMAFYKYELPSHPNEDWRALFSDYLKANNLPPEWND